MITPPPVELMHDGPQTAAEYIQNGMEYLGIYKNFCGLKPNAHMLDVGSGIGRKTIPLTNYFTKDASYVGIDVVNLAVDWCTENITSQFPNFRFFHINVKAPGYNKNGNINPVDFRFPFENGTFDFVALNSVFTHMKIDVIDNYLSEVRRVLKPSGKCLATYFLLNNILFDRCTRDRSLGFPHAFPTGRIADLDMPEQAIAFNEDIIFDLYERRQLIISKTNFGHWSNPNQKTAITYQDLLLAEVRHGSKS